MAILKYEDTFKVGDTIKAFGFPPRPDVEDSYSIGTIEGTKSFNDGTRVFEVRVSKDVFSGKSNPSRVGNVIYVPMEIWFDFDNRINNYQEKP